jgi:hypothetical protein
LPLRLLHAVQRSSASASASASAIMLL